MIGTEIASYRILEKLGEGGMGVVYKGVDTALDRPVAVKVLNSSLVSNAELVERFRAEARAQANLNHTNLATLYSFVIHEGNACMVMEFVDGETFEDLILRRGPVPALEAIPLFKQAMLGIGYAHRAGIVHRDIKPANLMVNRFGIVKVMDFGIAKVMGARGMTKTGTQMGTGWYMSPEQVLNKPVDIRSDIYSLGVTLYQMLTARVPFEGTSEFEIMSAHIQTPPPLPTRFYPYIPKGVENAVLKALSKNPNDRFQSVEEFGAALERPDDFAVQNGTPAPPRPAPAVSDQTATMIIVPPGGIPRTPTPPPAPPIPPSGAPAPSGALPPAKPLFATRQSKMIAGGAAVIAVALVSWFTLRDTSDQKSTLPSRDNPHSNGPTPLEQQLSSGSPGAQMSQSVSLGPKVDSFKADVSSASSGQKVHLSWSVSGASQVLITPGVGIVKAQGGVDVPLAKTTEFVLTAKDDKGQSATRATTVVMAQMNSGKPDGAGSSQMAGHVPADIPSKPASSPVQMQIPQPPARVIPTITFEAVPDSIPAGGATMLRWNLINAQSATIQPVPGIVRPPSGSVRIRPVDTTVYTLTAVSKDGVTATSMVTVQVQAAARPGFAINMVVHDHGATFGQNNVWNRCWGQLQVVGDHLQYRVAGTTDGRRDDFDVPLNQVQESAANRVPIRQQPAFHVTIAGQHYNFIPQGVVAAQAAAAIQREIVQGR